MPIETFSPRLRELGRIRIGRQVERARKDGKGTTMAPAKLDTFRLTARSEQLIRAAADWFGGEAVPWENPTEGSQWEVITERDWIAALIPPPFELDQSFELWSADGPLRRCTGRYTMDGEECICAAEFPDLEDRSQAATKGSACKPTTRLKLIIPGLPDIGVWRLETHGYYAATELMGAMAMIQMLHVDRPFPVTLRLEQRVKKVAGGSNIRYAVPALELPVSIQQALAASGREELMELGPADDRPKRKLRGPEANTASLETGKDRAGAEASPHARAPEPSESPAATGPAPERSEAAGDSEDVVSGGGDAHGPALETEVATAPTRPQATPDEIRELAADLGLEDEDALRHEYPNWRDPDDMTPKQLNAWRDKFNRDLATQIGAL